MMMMMLMINLCFLHLCFLECNCWGMSVAVDDALNVLNALNGEIFTMHCKSNELDLSCIIFEILI